MNSMSKRILVLDDDLLVLRSLEKALTRNGYNVLPVDGYDAAMAAIRDKDFDMVLSDIRMPGKDGVATTKEIQETLIKNGKKDLPIIFITGYSGEEVKLQAPLVGETLYKPVDLDKLLIAVREYL